MIPRVQRRFVDSVTVESVDAGATAAPGIDLYRNSASPADDDILGYVAYTGEDDAGNVAEYARIAGQATDVSNTTEDGSILFYAMEAGTLTNCGTLTGTGNLTIDGNINAAGTSHSLGKSGSTTTVSLASGGNNLILRNGNASKDVFIDFPSSNGDLKLRTHDGSSFVANITSLDSDGVLTHNVSSSSTGDAVFKGDTDADLFVVNAGADRIGVSVAATSMRHTFDCRGSRGYGVSKKTSDYTLTDADAIIYADASGLGFGATLTITLPTISKGRIYEIYRADAGSSGQSVTVSAPSSTYLNGTDAGGVTIGTQYNGVRVVGIDATNDWIAHELSVPSGGGP